MITSMTPLIREMKVLKKRILKESRYLERILFICKDVFWQDDDFGMDIGLGEEPGSSSSQKIEDEYFFEVSRFDK